MSAGVGSRFGGLKQIEPMGPSGEIMLDYSVFDAMRAGFGKVVFIIRHDIENDFKSIIGSHFAGRIPIDYVFQELSDLPAGFSLPADRQKPWGTGQAILSCKDVVKEPFLVINADDFYGRQAFQVLADYLRRPAPTEGPEDYAMVAFRMVNTLSEHGTVARGVCEVSSEGLLQGVEEHAQRSVAVGHPRRSARMSAMRALARPSP